MLKSFQAFVFLKLWNFFRLLLFWFFTIFLGFFASQISAFFGLNTPFYLKFLWNFHFFMIVLPNTQLPISFYLFTKLIILHRNSTCHTQAVAHQVGYLSIELWENQLIDQRLSKSGNGIIKEMTLIFNKESY